MKTLGRVIGIWIIIAAALLCVPSVISQSSGNTPPPPPTCDSTIAGQIYTDTGTSPPSVYTCSYYNLAWNWVINPSYGGIVYYPVLPATCSGALPVFLAGWPTTEMYLCVNGFPQAIGGSGGPGIGSIAWSIPSWLTANPTTIAASGTQTFSPTTGQTPHQVIGTCGAATIFGPCSLTAGDIPSLNYISGLTGDVAASGPGSAVATLATVNSAPGSCGDATHVCAITDNGKGLVTSQTSTAITFPGSGTVNTGTATQFAYYATTGSAVSGNANATVNSAGNAVFKASMTSPITNGCYTLGPASGGDDTATINAAINSARNWCVSLYPGQLYKANGQLTFSVSLLVFNGNGSVIETLYTAGPPVKVMSGADFVHLNDLWLVPGAATPYAALEDAGWGLQISVSLVEALFWS